jgi:hypothetical protein
MIELDAGWRVVRGGKDEQYGLPILEDMYSPNCCDFLQLTERGNGGHPLRVRQRNGGGRISKEH